MESPTLHYFSLLVSGSFGFSLLLLLLLLLPAIKTAARAPICPKVSVCDSVRNLPFIAKTSREECQGPAKSISHHLNFSSCTFKNPTTYLPWIWSMNCTGPKTTTKQTSKKPRALHMRNSSLQIQQEPSLRPKECGGTDLGLQRSADQLKSWIVLDENIIPQQDVFCPPSKQKLFWSSFSPTTSSSCSFWNTLYLYSRAFQQVLSWFY